MRNIIQPNNVYAVIGVSQNKQKWGYKVYKKLLNNGFTVFPVNPNYKDIDGKAVYPDLASLPQVPDVVSTVVPPAITERIVKQAKQLGIKRVWMQPGSESEKAIQFCEEHNIEVIHNACIVQDGLKQQF